MLAHSFFVQILRSSLYVYKTFSSDLFLHCASIENIFTLRTDAVLRAVHGVNCMEISKLSAKKIGQVVA